MTTMTEQEQIRVLREVLQPFLTDPGAGMGHVHAARKALAATATIQPVAAPEKRAPVQGYTPGIPWSLHLEAYDAYRKRYGSQHALIEGGCRGGFGVGELDMFIPGWRDKVSEIGRLKARIAELEAAAPAQAAPDEGWNAALEEAAMVCIRFVGLHDGLRRAMAAILALKRTTAAPAATPADSQKGEGE